ncbi:MAG TPA: elongation factor EF-2 [Candidatus Nanoarchaeia archaeon]|nr:elongation factor EF-2 [Candidatus Nanoarchaeia archaeon]
MASEEEKLKKILELMKKPEKIRNIGIVAHIDHGKTTMTDSLLAGAGMISEEIAGKACYMDFHEDERERGITIDSASANMLHNLDGEDYLVNLIDTPGHVDFSGEVTRAMRACDGAVVVVCAAEGMMPQTETVLRQALRERVRPVLLINKVDRLIKELKLNAEQMQERFVKIINGVNKYIDSIVPPEFKGKWRVDVKDGSVSFGSGKEKWAINFNTMQKLNIKFADVVKAYQEGKVSELSKKSPLHKTILDMVVKHVPNPKDAQKYRIPKLWQGDLESEEGKALVNCDPNGPVVFVATKIIVDPQAGEIVGGRLFSGTVQRGQDVYMIMAKKATKIQQVNLSKGPQRIIVDAVPAGNMVALAGLKGANAGETISTKEIDPFESLKHIFEPVVTESIEAKKPSDLPKLIEVLKTVQKEDPTVKVELDEQTGQHLLSGMGELHLEVIANRIRTEKGVDVTTSNPIVVYRETVEKPSKTAEGKSPNKHNIFFMQAAPLEENVHGAIVSGDIMEGRVKKKNEQLWKTLSQLGISNEEARQYRHIYKGNVLLDKTKGEVHIGEVIDMVADAFEQVIDAGPLAREPCMKLKILLMDTKLHEDAIHRGPAQVYPAVRDGIRGAMESANATVFEPVQVLQIDSEMRYMSNVTSLVQSKRGQMMHVEQEGEHISMRVKMPVSEMIGFASDLRGATEGRGTFSVVDQLFAKLPNELRDKTIKQIRQRKGLAENE